MKGFGEMNGWNEVVDGYAARNVNGAGSQMFTFMDGQRPDMAERDSGNISLHREAPLCCQVSIWS
jgi:hypothetical protein